MTGFYLKERGLQGETPSLKRILEKYIENSPLWHFFFSLSLSETILYLSLRVESVLGRGGVGGGSCFFMLV